MTEDRKISSDDLLRLKRALHHLEWNFHLTDFVDREAPDTYFKYAGARLKENNDIALAEIRRVLEENSDG